MQVQIQALIVERAVVGRKEEGSNVGFYIEVAKPPVFNGEAGKVAEFITAYRLYLRIKRSNGRRADLVDSLICTERINRCMERKHIGRSRSRRNRIQVSKRILDRIKKKVWRRE